MHLRYLTGCIKDWPALFREAYRCTTPGGYVESYDGGPVFYSDDDTLKDTHAIAQWGKLFNEGGKKIGQTFDVIAENIQREGMEDAGFVVVGQKDVKVGCLVSTDGLRVSQRCYWLTVLDAAGHVA